MTQSGTIDPAAGDESGEGLAPKITRFLRRCWMKRKMVFAIVAIGVSISLLKAVLAKNVYTATTSFLPPDSSSSATDLLGAMGSSASAESLSSRILGLETPGELYVAILKSRNVSDSLIAHFGLMKYYDARFPEDAYKSLSGDTNIDLDRKSGVVSVSFTSTSPDLSANVARGFVMELNRVLTEDSTSSARRERIFLEGRLREVKQELDDTSKALSQFSTRNKTIDLPTQEKSMVDEGARLQAELISGKSQLAGLRQTYGEDNARVRSIEARNQELQRQIDALGGSSKPSGSRPDQESRSYPSASELPALGITYFDLDRKLRVEGALWEALTRQYEMAKVEEAEQIQSARVLDVASVPEKKSGPKRRASVMIGTLISIILAGIAVLVQSVWEQMNPEEEPKRLLLDAAEPFLDRRRWYWRVPGMGLLRNRLGE